MNDAVKRDGKGEEGSIFRMPYPNPTCVYEGVAEAPSYRTREAHNPDFEKNSRLRSGSAQGWIGRFGNPQVEGEGRATVKSKG